jgi:ferredoxin-nitrite reductase
LNFAGLHIPVGRLYAQDMFDLARIAEVMVLANPLYC